MLLKEAASHGPLRAPTQNCRGWVHIVIVYVSSDSKNIPKRKKYLQFFFKLQGYSVSKIQKRVFDIITKSNFDKLYLFNLFDIIE